MLRVSHDYRTDGSAGRSRLCPDCQPGDLLEYVADHVFPGMLQGALRFSDHPRAVVRSIDTTAAEAAPGVVAVVTAAGFAATVAQVLLLRELLVLFHGNEMSVGLALILAIPIGIISAVKQHSWFDYFFTFIGFIGLATPSFLLAALVHEKLLRPMKCKQRCHEVGDPKAFTEKVAKLTAPKAVKKKAPVKKKRVAKKKTTAKRRTASGS